MTQIVCINGYKRSGKGEVGKAIASIGEDQLWSVKQVGFADKLKVAAAKALGFDRPDAELIAFMDSFKETAIFNVRYDEPWVDILGTDVQRRPKGPLLHELTGRQYLQWFGTEVGRDMFGNDFWVDQVLPQRPEGWSNLQFDARVENEVHKIHGNISHLAITDCRFVNEADRALSLGGEVWEILRPETDAEGDHASEKRLPRELVTRHIVNDGTLMDLRWKVEKALGL